MFFVFGMPRSRTKWLSAFLTHGDIVCHHEYVSKLRDLDELSALSNNGTAETFGIWLWEAIYRRFPNARYVVIRRDPVEVEKSMERQGVPFNVAQCENVMKRMVESLPALVIDYDHIDWRLQDIWQHCRRDRMPYGREDMREQNIQEPVRDQLARVDPENLRRLIECSA